MPQAPITHTFHFLDIPKLDRLFSNYDDYTDLELEVNLGCTAKANRVVYHLVRKIAQLVEVILYSLVVLLKGLVKLVQYTALTGKVALLTIAKTPTAIRKKFWPTQSELIHKRVDSLNQALLRKTAPLVKPLFTENGRKLSHEEKKGACHAWITQNPTIRCTKELRELDSLLAKLADGDLSEAVYEQIEERVAEISDQFKEKFPHLPLIAGAFVEEFRAERKTTKELTIQPTSEGLATLLNHPNLLKRADVEKIVHEMDNSSLRTQVLQKMDQIHQRVVESAHQTEQEILRDLSKQLEDSLSVEELQEKYAPTSKKRYLKGRGQAIDTQIAALKEQEPSFIARLLMLEREHLEQQFILMNRNYTKVCSKTGDLNDLGNIRERNIDSVNELLVQKARGSLNRLDKIVGGLPEESAATWKTDHLSLSTRFESWPEADMNHTEFFAEVTAFTKALQKLERELIPHIPLSQKSIYLDEMQTSLRELTVLKGNIDSVHESYRWLDELKTSDQIDLERKDALAKEIICLSLEKKTECQLPLKLARKDARADKNGGGNGKPSAVETKLEELSTEFVTSLQEKYLVTCKLELPSLREFVTGLEEDRQMDSLQPTRNRIDTTEALGFNFERFAQSLEIAEPLQKWHRGLQQVWVDHLPREQEEAILAISSRDERQKKMADCFSAWILERTGRQLIAPLSFEQIEIRDLSVQREEALEKMQQAIWDRQLRDRPTSILYRDKRAPEKTPATPPHAGFALNLIEPPLPTTFDAEPVQSYAGNYADVLAGSTPFTNALRALHDAREKLELNPHLPPIEKRFEWIKELHTNRNLTGLRDRRLMILAECEVVALECFKNNRAVPEQILEIFAAQFDLKQVENLERRALLTTLLLMVLAPLHRQDSIQMTEPERSYLVQFCSLSYLPIEQISGIMRKVAVVDRGGTLSQRFAQIGEQLQNSSIGLEGVEESTLQRSFQNAGLRNEPGVRGVLDLWRSRSGELLLPDLLRFSLTQDLRSEQGREVVSRALFHASKVDLDKTITFINSQQTTQVLYAKELNEATLAPPLRIFYYDCALTLPYNNLTDVADREVREFNEGLIQSTDLHQRFMGYAREINRLSMQIQFLDSEIFVRLLKYKIAYQTLKIDYYDGKREIAGFLKVAAHAAEAAMLSSTRMVQKKLTTAHLSGELRQPLLENKLPTEKYVGKILQELFKGRETDALEPNDLIPGFISLGFKVDIDGVLGILYYDGTQKTNLPPQLQNHPYVRSLGIQALPYVYNSTSRAFCYLTGSGGARTPQIMVVEKNGKPVIQKRLPTAFDGRALGFLQFVSKEELALPYAVAHRMGIRDFWQDENRSFYGYNSSGDLTAILQSRYQNQDRIWTLTASDGEEYQFFASLEDHPIKKYLDKSFNPNEILINRDNLSVWIPAIGLRLAQEGDEWKCEGKGVVGKILDTSVEPSSYLPLKNEGGTQRASRLKDQLILAQKHIVAAETAGLSRVSKQAIEELERKRARIAKDLSEAEGRVCLTLLSEPAFEAPSDHLWEDVDAKIQEELEDRWQEYKKENSEIQLPFQTYQLALRFLSEELQQRYRDISQQVAPEDQETAQQSYLTIETAYKAVQQKYAIISDRPAEWVLFKRTVDNTILSSDLTGALALSLNRSDKNEPLQLITELAKYPILQPLSDSQLALLEKAQRPLKESLKTTEVQLYTYLCFMKYQHQLYQVEELAHTPLLDKREQVERTTEALGQATADCTSATTCLFKQFTDKDKFSPELIALCRKTALYADHLAKIAPEEASLELQDMNPAKAVVTGEFVYLGQQSLLERLQATSAIQALPKDLERELSEPQKSLIRSFQKHSPKQVSGFYLEEMGRFNLAGFYDEFRLNLETERALFGLKKSQLDELFNLLIKKTCDRKGNEVYYSLISPEHATSRFNREEVRASITDLPLSAEQLEKIIGHLQAFLSKAAQASFTFSFTNEKARVELMQKLEKAKNEHTANWLDAEAFLQTKLAPLKIPLVDLKYALLSGNYQKFRTEFSTEELSALRNALIRYLFHKTEAQHIANIQNAPTVGERNQIELLQTKRNYSADLLLFAGELTDEESREQTMQRAFLVFEEDYGFRCNAMQIQMFHSLLLDSRDDEAIDAAQARMGFGKTALLPLMAIVRVALERCLSEEERHLVRYVVPRAVIEDNTSAFNKTLSSILGGNVVKDREFTRYQIDKEQPLTSFEFILKDLDGRLASYKEARKRGDVLIQWPEIRGSMEAQELDFGEMVSQGMDEESLEICLQCKRRLGEIRSLATYTIFDELDDTQDIKSREVNYTKGDKRPIPPSSIVPLYTLINFVGKQRDWQDQQAIARAMLVEVAGLQRAQITQPLLDYLTDRNKPMNEGLFNVLTPELSGFLKKEAGSQEIYSESDSAIFLIRALLLDQNILAFAKSKQPNTHFGARFIERAGEERKYFQDPDSESPFLIAVPYEGTNTPKGLSVFDNTEVAAITTIRYYLSNETLLSKYPYLDFLITQIRKKSIPQNICDLVKQERNRQGRSPIDQLQEISGLLDETELKLAKERFYKDFMEAPSPKFRQFLGMAIVATQIRSDAASAKSDRYERGSWENIEKGCSGTVGGTSSYFDKQELDAAADAKLSIEIMGRENNAPIKELTPPTAGRDYLTQILETILANANENSRAIVDAAGICKSRDGTPETVVAELWKKLEGSQRIRGVEGIVYYGKDNVKRLYRGPRSPTIPCTTEMEMAALQGKRYFSFYGQKNTRGSDIKQANGAHALVTMDENVSNSDAKQAILRFRNLVNRKSGQTFSFAFMPSYGEIVQERLIAQVEREIAKAAREVGEVTQQLNGAVEQKTKKNLKDAIHALGVQIRTLQQKRANNQQEPIQAKEVANFLRLQEIDSEEKGALTIFRKEMAAHVKQAAAHLEQDILGRLANDDLSVGHKQAYLQFLRERRKIVAFLEESVTTLFKKYGTTTADMERDQFIALQRQSAQERLKLLFKAAKIFRNAVELGDATGVNQAFYHEQIDRSEKFFKQRFDPHTLVQISAVNTDAQAVAEAQAEALALAEAQAEALAENLAENEVEVVDWRAPPIIRMARDHHIVPTLDFLRDKTLLIPVEEFSIAKKLIRPDQRSEYFASPYLMKNGKAELAAHFVLQPMKRGEATIFISQEEAELFKKNYGEETDEYHLSDARLIPTKMPISCAILQDNGVLTSTQAGYPQTVEALRKVELTNVLANQLLPHFQVEGESSRVDLTRLGLKKDGVVVNFLTGGTAEAVEIAIECGDLNTVVTIPKGNKWLDQFIPKIYANESIGKKFLHIQDLIKIEYTPFKEKLKELKENQTLLRQQEQRLKTILSDPNIGAFDITSNMISGLKMRDENPGMIQAGMGNYGKDFLQAVTKIKTAHTNFSRNGSLENICTLKNAFDEFVDPKTIENAINIKNNARQERGTYSTYNTPQDPLFTVLTWNTDRQNMRPLELVYGRILYTVHQGNLYGAITCGKDDCSSMFNETLPALIKSIGILNDAIKNMTDIQCQIEPLQKQIAEIEALTNELGAALTTVESILKTQNRIEQTLSVDGIRFSEQDQFFDRFLLEDFNNWNGKEAVSVTGTMPDYVSVVENMEREYPDAITALTEEEATVLEKNKKFLTQVKKLAWQLEDRTQEIK